MDICRKKTQYWTMVLCTVPLHHLWECTMGIRLPRRNLSSLVALYLPHEEMYLWKEREGQGCGKTLAIWCSLQCFKCQEINITNKSVSHKQNCLMEIVSYITCWVSPKLASQDVFSTFIFLYLLAIQDMTYPLWHTSFLCHQKLWALLVSSYPSNVFFSVWSGGSSFSCFCPISA